MTPQSRKPRIALMGEFSAGKSTLSNLLLGARPLPEKVTATRLSPVWISSGTAAPYRVDVDGNKEPVRVDQLDGIPVEETRVIRLFFEADVLDLCDLIDFPGISDPNMSSQVWQRMLDEVDAVIWCTHATQAWRQSEAAVWSTIPQAVREKSILLITRFDKLTTERDCQRVLGRLAKETAGLFAATFPISLTNALAAGDDYDAFEASGGIAFLQYFLNMIENLNSAVAESDETHISAPRPARPSTPVAPADPVKQVTAVAETVQPAFIEVENEPAPELAVRKPIVRERALSKPEPVTADASPVIPRRVRPQAGGGRRMRPARAGAAVDMTETTAPAHADAALGRASSATDLRAVFQETPRRSDA